ncbi:MAG: permease [Alphaproteobacteria bacterium]|nr:permease [Alphaproteobacteria bacterium]
MSGQPGFAMLALIGFCIVFEAGREICFKLGADSSTLLQALAKPVIWLGIGFWAIEVVAWISALEYMPLSIAYPLMSLSYVAILLGGALVFNESVSKSHAAGAFLITAGVACIGSTGI